MDHQNFTAPGAYVTGVKKFFIKFRLQISPKRGGDALFTHDYDSPGKVVMLQLPVDTIGDSIGWFSYVERFQQYSLGYGLSRSRRPADRQCRALFGKDRHLGVSLFHRQRAGRQIETIAFLLKKSFLLSFLLVFYFF